MNSDLDQDQYIEEPNQDYQQENNSHGMNSPKVVTSEDQLKMMRENAESALR